MGKKIISKQPTLSLFKTVKKLNNSVRLSPEPKKAWIKQDWFWSRHKNRLRKEASEHICNLIKIVWNLPKDSNRLNDACITALEECIACLKTVNNKQLKIGRDSIFNVATLHHSLKGSLNDYKLYAGETNVENNDTVIELQKETSDQVSANDNDVNTNSPAIHRLS